MNINMMLMSSAAALAAFSSAQAADAIVAAEPEAVEYVRVCDAYGSGYFYIPGTETCLKISGYIRFQTNGGPNASATIGNGTTVANNSDWDAYTRGQVQFTAKSDTEYGPLTGVIVYQLNADNASSQLAKLDSAYIDVAGFRAGLFYSWWDDGLSGETDDIGSKVTLHNSIRYQYEADNFYAGISVDELEDGYYSTGERPNNVGVAIGIGGKAGAFGYQITAGYDVDNEEGAVRAMGTVAIGPGNLGLAGIYSSAPNSYYQAAEWVVAGEYAFKATDKLKITPGFQYYGNYGIVAGDFNDDNDAWKVGLTADYQIADNIYAKATVNYLDPDTGNDVTTGFFRLQRAF
ncbi:porin [Rhizobium cauense]|uniref:porin n=1 Tax=Rhizobium cauense TaxID=1166683 RepID=UPI001C6F4364|nr:porin [Rhizobium cauense]MBW9114591.1 porin [Rhizobium cauense]